MHRRCNSWRSQFMMKSIHAVRQFILALMPLFTLAPLKGELAFAKQKTEGSIFLTFTSNLPSTRPALVLLFLALLEREGGIRRMTGGYIFLTFISYLPFTRPALMPLWHILCPERQRMQNALGGVDTARHFQNILIVRLQQQTTKRSGCTIYPRIRLIKFIPQMLTIAKGSAF